jgi:hypothetical protein
MIANLIETLTKATLNTYKINDEITEQFVLETVRDNQEILDKLDGLSFEDYVYVMERVFDDASNAIYGNPRMD